MKNFFTKLKNFFVKLIPSRRRIVQLYTALLYNANIKGFVTGKISTAGTKNVCVPGFNCYSCPGAVGSCPLGSLQNALGSAKTSTISYVFGILMLFGLILGRTICGFLCPMGLLQDLAFMIKSPKAKKNKFTKILSYFKYLLLVAFVIVIPLVYSGKTTLPAFCQYVCPVGTISGLTLLVNPANASELVSLGVLFTWKFCLTALLMIGTVFVYRLFCRFFCPLGALYSLFSRFCLLGVQLDQQKCIDCGKCIQTCQVDINRVGDHECIQCGKCLSVCPTQAISWKGGNLFVLPNQIEQPRTCPSVDLANVQPTDVATEMPNVANDTTVNRAVEQSTQTVSKKIPLYTLRKNNGKGFKIIATVLAIVALLTSLVYFNFVHQETYATTTYGVGDTLPNFTANRFFTDDTYSLENDAGKIVVLNFWYITCGGCELEMPHFGKLASDANYKDKVSVVVIHSNSEAFDGYVARFEEYVTVDKGWDFYQSINWLMDLDGEQSLYLALGGVGAWPMTAILDGNGTIRFVATASVTEETLYQQIDAILAE